MQLPDYAFSEPRGSPRRSPKKHQAAPNPPHQSNISNYVLLGVFILVPIVLIPLLWNVFSNVHVDSESHKYDRDDDSHQYRLEMSKFKEDMSLNEFVNRELMRILPGLELDEKTSVFLSSDISEKMMKLYHDESLNIFKTKVEEYEVHKNILEEKYNKGKIIGESLLKEIEGYEQCDPELHEIKDKIVKMVNKYNNIFKSKNDYDSNIGNFLTKIKNKEAELDKLRREYEIEKGILLKNSSDLRFNNPEERLRREIEKIKLDIDTLKKYLKDSPEKLSTRVEKLTELRTQLESREKELSDYLAKKNELNEFAKEVEQEARELSSKEILDILRSDYNSRVQKLQDLAQTILESAQFEKNEVYYHKKATPEDKKNSIQVLENIKARYKDILQLILKVSYKVHLRAKDQARSDEKTHAYHNLYGQIKELEGKIDALNVKINELRSQIKRLQDEINLHGDQGKEKLELLRKNEDLLAEKETLLKDLNGKLGQLSLQIADLTLSFQGKEKELRDTIASLENDKKDFDKSKSGYSDNLNHAYKEFIESATSLNKKINDCKIIENVIKRMIENFLSFIGELEKFESRKENLENEIRKMYESLENQSNLPSH